MARQGAPLPPLQGVIELWLITLVTPSDCMETPNSTSDISMVRRWCVIMMSCVSLRMDCEIRREPAQVGVVERRLNLVEDVKRRRCACDTPRTEAQAP